MTDQLGRSCCTMLDPRGRPRGQALVKTRLACGRATLRTLLNCFAKLDSMEHLLLSVTSQAFSRGTGKCPAHSSSAPFADLPAPIVQPFGTHMTRGTLRSASGVMGRQGSAAQMCMLIQAGRTDTNVCPSQRDWQITLSVRRALAKPHGGSLGNARVYIYSH